MTMYKFAISLILFLIPASIAAQDEEPRLKVSLTGRVLVDGALYASPQKSLFPDGVAIPEARIGASMRYGNWSSAIDVSYAYSKIGLRNMWIEYGFDKANSLRIGNFIHQFGLQSTSGSTKCTMEQPIASALFTPGLQLGAMFVHHDSRLYASFSANVESSALSQVVNAPLFNQQGYGLHTRIVWRKPVEGAPIWHIGISGGFATPQRHVEDNEDIHDGFTVSANFPTKVVQLSAIGTTVYKAKNLFKFTPEFVFAYKKGALEVQYFFQQINRRQSLEPFLAQSGYVTLRGVLIGGEYGYNSATAQLKNPRPGSLECVLDYNYANLSDSKAAIFGGISNSASATLNYYFNPYITARLNYTYVHRWNRADADPVTFNGFQARLMVLF